MGVFNALASGTFLPWRRRANRETDYETVLARLEGEISEVQSRLTQIRLRERRASVTLTLQAFLLWAVYTAVCWFFGLLTLARGGSKRTMLVWVPVLTSPVLIISTRRIVRWWYRRIGAAEDKHLIDLRRQKRDKVDEIKRATKYDHLRMLLDKYDDSTPKPTDPTTPTKQKPNPKPNATPSKASPSVATTPSKTGGAPALSTPEAQALQAQRMALMRQQGGASASAVRPPALPVAKTWMDKVADAILGADPTATGPEQKYALICARCHAHNGLALREEFHEVQYVCPHCGHFNSRRPSSAPVGSPFNSQRPPRSADAPAQPVETPSKPSRTTGSRLKLRADEPSDDEDRPPQATLEDESVRIDAPDAKDEPDEQPRRSLRARKSQSKTERMDLDDD